MSSDEQGSKSSSDDDAEILETVLSVKPVAIKSTKNVRKPRAVKAEKVDRKTSTRKPRAVKKRLTEEEKALQQAQKELTAEKDSTEVKAEKRLQRRQLVEQAKESLRQETALNNLPVGFPPVDFWRAVFGYLREVDLILLRGVSKFFLYFYGKDEWRNIFQIFLKRQGFTAEPILRLLGAKHLLADGKGTLKREQMDCIEREIKNCNNRNLLRIVVETFALKRKKYNVISYAPLFYSQVKDAEKYQKAISELTFLPDWERWTPDALRLIFNKDLKVYLDRTFAFAYDHRRAFTYFLEWIEQDPRAEDFFERGLYDWITTWANFGFLEVLFKRTLWPQKWLFPRMLVKNQGFWQWLVSQAPFSVIVYSNSHMRGANWQSLEEKLVARGYIRRHVPFDHYSYHNLWTLGNIALWY